MNLQDNTITEEEAGRTRPGLSLDIKPANKEAHENTQAFMTAPWPLALLSFIAGPLAAGMTCATVLFRLQSKAMATALACVTPIFSLLLYGFLIFQPMKWFWSSLILLGVHLLCAVAVYVGMRKAITRANAGSAKIKKKEKTYILAGLFGGGLMLLCLAPAFSGIYILLADKLFNTLIPVAFNDYTALIQLIFTVFILFVSGCIAGGFLGKHGVQISAWQAMVYVVFLMLIGQTWFFFQQLLISIPVFQAGAAGGRSSVYLSLINLALCLWWPAFLFLFCVSPSSYKSKTVRLVQVIGVNFCAVFSLAIFFGCTTSWFNSTGRVFEQRGFVSKALDCYQLGLDKQPNQRIAGYLKYRVALLAHKLGDNEAAIKGFKQVISRYNRDDVNQDLIKKSSRYLDYLKQSDPSLKRVVLPGVETPTTYKSAYCAPNSLALVFHFWGQPFSASTIGHRITDLSKGTSFIDQAWYAHDQGFVNSFFPMSDLKDIKDLIDAGMPVLAYVPGHVFAVVGYDEQLKTLVTYDVATRDVWVDYFEEDFLKAWKKSFATLAVVYPESKASLLPESLLKKRENSDAAYLHFILHYFNGPDGFPGKESLEFAASQYPPFFVPQVILDKDFNLNADWTDKEEKKDDLVSAISNYFSRGFDEGVHLWGQKHYEDSVRHDKNFKMSLDFLARLQYLDQVKRLIHQVRTHGPVSSQVENLRAMLDIAQNNLEKGAQRLEAEAPSGDYAMYLALSKQALGKRENAVRPFVSTVRKAASGCG